MKKKIKQSILKRLLTSEQLKKIQTPGVNFPGGILPINNTMLNDVFIVGFPKSGNTLMQHIIAHLYYGLNEEASRTMVNLITPDIYANSHYFRFNEVCFFKSHDLPKPEYKKVIYIMRDGREALLSYYHMMKNMGTPVSLKDLYSGKIKLYNVTWGEHIAQWESNPYQADILWIKYEDLKANKINILQRICTFLNIDRSTNELEKVIEFTSLKHMKEMEKRIDWAKMKKNKFLMGKNFVRQGGLDSYKKEVRNTLIKIFEKNEYKALEKYYPNQNL
tara:strand:- start:906 stop:1733 length:828 start_codon:yes stop_codon:yes gene_type:complete